MSELFPIAVVMVMFAATFGGFHALLHKRGIGYIDHFGWTSLYFLTIAVMTSLLFWNRMAGILDPFSGAPLIVLAVFMSAQAILYVCLPRWVREPSDYFEKYPDRYYLKIHWKRIASKSADILAQQVFIVLLVVSLKDAGLALSGIIVAFFFLFALLHVPLFISGRGAWPTWLFAGAVAAFSFIFPVLILYVPYGFVYNFIIHSLFYTVTGFSFWVLKAAYPVSADAF